MTKLVQKAKDEATYILDGVETFKAANGKGWSILQEMVYFSEGKNYTVPKRLYYAKGSKAWLDEMDKPVIFDLTQTGSVAQDFVEAFKANLDKPEAAPANAKAHRAKKEASTVGGTITTDTGKPLSADTQPESETVALKVDNDN